MTDSPHILIFDGYNFLHRSRSGFTKGDYAIVFNFFRALRSEVERHQPTRVTFVVEGSPKRQISLDGEYKANRAIKPGTKQEKSFEDFLRQKTIIMELLKNFPVSIMKHDDFEADDTIYNIVASASSAIPFTIVSTDTDYIQILNWFGNVKLYEPIKKKYVQSTEYPYTIWKALRGDASDNIPGVVSDKVATEACVTAKQANELIKSLSSEDRERYEKNLKLITFYKFSVDEAMNVSSTLGMRSWETVKEKFESFAFKSITNEKSWNKFVNTFDRLF